MKNTPSNMKAQASMEFLVTIAVVVAFAVPVFMLLFSLSQFGLENASVAQAEGAAKKISDNVNEAFAFGAMAKRTILVNLPSNTQSVAIKNNQVVVSLKTSSGKYDAVAPIFAKINNAYSHSPILDNTIQGGARRTGSITMIIKVNSEGQVEINA